MSFNTSILEHFNEAIYRVLFFAVLNGIEMICEQRFILTSWTWLRKMFPVFKIATDVIMRFQHHKTQQNVALYVWNAFT